MCDENASPNNQNKSTPPKKKVRNPFDKALIERLHTPICSPGMCKTYKRQNNGTFRWDIDQACTLVPKDFTVCSSQFEPSPDPALEKIAEEANERFFSQEMIMPSPLESSKKTNPPKLSSSINISAHITSCIKEQTIVLRDVSAQTVLTLPPALPPEIEKLLEPFCTYTQDQHISCDFENSLRRKLFFEEHSDPEHYDSEQTDDEVHMEHHRPASSNEVHTPLVFSPDLSRNLVAKGMKRTFGTPLNKGNPPSTKPCYRNKILDVVDFGEPCFSPIEFRTPKRVEPSSASSSSLATASISPVNKASSSDEEKNNFTSPESDPMATCLNCVMSDSDVEKKGPCFCKSAPNKSILKRSTSLKESPPRCRKGSLSERRSSSMSSLNRSRSVQKLDFSMEMSIDESLNQSQADSESSPSPGKQTWSIVDESKLQVIKMESHEIQSSTKIHSLNILDETPIKGKCKSSIRSHEISKIRTPFLMSPGNMSLDDSIGSDNLNLEDKNVDFNNIDLKFLTENIKRFDSTGNVTKIGSSSDNSSSFKRIDSGFNENTFYANASSYYGSAIKASELTVTANKNNKTALKEISNVQWMRVDSGFRDENSADSMNFYPTSESIKKVASFQLSSAISEDKENIVTDDFDKFLVHNKNETMSVSDIFTDEITFNCNFSSTPSKNKSNKNHS